MKNILLAILLTIFPCNLLFAQTGWVSQTNPLGLGENAMLGKVYFSSQNEGWISHSESSGFLHTTNGGLDWTLINPFPEDTVFALSDQSFSSCWIGQSHGWKIASFGSLWAGGIVVYRTTNGGINWLRNVISTNPDDFGIEIQFVNVNNGWALIYNFSSGVATFLRTTDGGNSWAPFNGTGIFFFTDPYNGWSFYGSGQNGSDPPFKILKTSDGGDNWTEQFTDNTPGQLSCFFFSDLNNGWVVGRNGKILKTNNGGTTWTYVTNAGVNPAEDCKTVFFLTPLEGWICSKISDIQQTPYLQHTTDGGNTWETQLSPFGDQNGSNAIFSIFFIDSQTGWITGDLGRIAKYYGTTDVEEEINSLNKFSLHQNYPNPFNPSTTIRYQVPDFSFVSLIVYDLLGNKIQTLVNEEKHAGNYEIEFSSVDLPGGVYFYQLNAGSYAETKKMLLLK
jgi:photosystem II stability/assembly factor-like uncharacterized protein